MQEGKDDSRKLCGFDKEPCIEDKCMLWVQVQVGTLTPGGIVAGQAVSMCVFPAIMMAVGSPKPATQHMALPNLKHG